MIIEWYSFDVFDTCIARPFTTPETVFELVALNTVVDHSTVRDPVRFRKARQEAELQAREENEGGEVILVDIYRVLQSSLGLTTPDLEVLMRTEIRMEREHWKPIGEIQRRISGLRQAGRKICFASNMYLPAALIREALQEFEMCMPGDPLFVSGEIGKSKDTGELFTHLSQSLKVPFEAICHTGDNEVADVTVPRRMGIHCEPFIPYRAGRYESIATAHSTGSLIWSSFLAGTSRHLRNTLLPCSTLQSTAVQVVAPVLFGYVTWVLQKALQDGIEHLYFVSRDGFLLKQIADACILAWGCPLQTHYLLGSRAAWHAAALRRPLTQATWLLEGADASLAGVSSLMKVNWGELRNRLEGTRWSGMDWNAQSDLPTLKSFLNDVEALAGEWVEACHVESDDLKLARQYFEECGLSRHSRVAIVDLGWRGRNHDSLDVLLGQPVAGYYLALEGNCHQAIIPLRKSMFPEWFDNAHPRVPDSFMYLLEAFSTENAGTVLGYQRGQFGIEARRSEFPGHELDRWGIQLLQDSVSQYASHLAPLLRDTFRSGVPDCTLKQCLESVLRLFSIEPTAEEVRIWAGYPYQTSQGSSHTQPLAQRYPFTPDILWRWLRSESHPCPWLPGRRVDWKSGSRILTETCVAGRLMSLVVRTKRRIRRKLRGL